MQRYTDTVYELLDEQVDKLKSGDCCLSAYFPTENYHKKQILHRIKPLINVPLRKSRHTKKFTKPRKDLIKKVLDEIRAYNEVPEGIAIFARISPDKVEYLRILALTSAPKNEVTIAKTFDIDQLAWLSLLPKKVIVLNLKAAEAGIYTLAGDDFSLIKKLENQYHSDREPEYKERFSPVKGQNIVHGTGDETTAKSEKHANENFLNDVKEEIKKEKKKFKKPQIFISVYSNRFSDFINDFTDNIKSQLFPDTHIKSISKNITDKNELKKLALKELKAYRKNQSKKDFSDAKENYPLFTKGWTKVAKAARNGNIKTLFISLQNKKMGYVLDKDLPFTRAVKNSKRVSNLAPWIVQKAIDTGAEIKILPENFKKTIAAKKRYT